MNEAVIVSAVRTATGKFQGSLKGLHGAATRCARRRRSRAARRHRCRVGRRVHHGQRRVRRTRTESGPPGGAARRTCRSRCRADHQQGLRLRAEGGDAGAPGDCDGRHRDRRRRRHGVDEQLPVPHAEGPRRRPHGQHPASSTRWSTTASGARSRTTTWAMPARSSPASTESAARRRTPSPFGATRRLRWQTEAGAFTDEILPVPCHNATAA